MEQIGDLILIKELCHGSFGKVYLSKKANPNILYATKKINRAPIDMNSKRKGYFETEINIMKVLNHPNIIKLTDLKKDKNYYYVVMEYANGGDLDYCLKVYIKKYNRPFPEEIVKYLMKQIVEAVAYIHSNNIIHRDIKLTNILVNFDSEKDKLDLNMMKAKIKITDFAVSKIAKQTFTVVGTPSYMDPLLLKEYANKTKLDELSPYGQEVDIWSLGCLCYELFMGELPFKGKKLEELLKQVQNRTYELPTNISPELKDFLSKMLQYEGKSRLTAEELLNHPFLKKNVKDFDKASINLSIINPFYVPKYNIYSSKEDSAKEIQFSNQPETRSYEIPDENIKIYTSNIDNTNINTAYNLPTTYITYCYGPMTTTNLNPNMQTANFQSGQYPFPQSNFGPYIPAVQNQEGNINSNFAHF